MGISSLAIAALASTGAQEPSEDWLLSEQPFEARFEVDEERAELVLTNGIVRRTWRLGPNAACVGLDDLSTDRALLRAVRPEARLVIDGQNLEVGGLIGQVNQAYLLDEWVDELRSDRSAFQFTGFLAKEMIEPRLEWLQVRHHAPDVDWPPRGVTVVLEFEPGLETPESLAGVFVNVHYELYDGLPLFSKWVTVENRGERTIELDRCTTEILAVVEWGNSVEKRAGVALRQPDSIHVETDYAFGSFVPDSANRFAVHWREDPEFTTQVNYLLKNPCLLVVEPTRGPDVLIEPGETFTSLRAFELIQDSSERERRGLALRRMYRTLAPWVTENPLILHVVSTDEAVVRTAIDQAAECGFEMVSLSFGSGLSMEDDDADNLTRFRELAEYAELEGIHLGGYSLLSSRRITPDTDNCINADTGEPGGQTHGFCPALASNWGQEYFRKLRKFFESTGFLQFTHDGSYPGDFDAAARPPLQRGLDDSQWVQRGIITEFYQWLRARGVYLRVPDYYYLSGSNECGMGYREVNWSLPRAQQVIHTRQNIFDGTWQKTPSMGWMFVPLTQYHGGGEAATIEPLDDHLDHYERMLASNLGLGVQAVYRGTRLFDTERVRDAVKRWVRWYKRYRYILESDVIHGRRADGRDLDWMLHVNPRLDRKGMLVVYNPLAEEVTRTLAVNLYYTGLDEIARVSHEGGAAVELELARDYGIELEVTVPAGGMTWFVIE